MDSIIAVFPARAMSITSPRLPGFKRTRSPGFNSIPAMFKLSAGALSSRSRHSHSFIASLVRLTQAAQHSVKFHEMFHGHGFRAFQDLAGAIVGVAHFLFFVFCQSENAQSENFVYFRSVE